MKKNVFLGLVFLTLLIFSFHLIADEENDVKFVSGWVLFTISILGPAYLILSSKTYYSMESTKGGRGNG